MFTDNLFYPLLSIIPALLNFGIIIYIFFFIPKGKSSTIFSFFVLALLFWQLEDSIVRICNTEETARFWDSILSIGWAGFAPVAFHFIGRYIGAKWISRRIVNIAIYLPFVLLYFLYHANPIQTEFIYHEGWGWVNTPRAQSLDGVQRSVISLYVIASVIMLFIHAVKMRNHTEKKVQAFLIAAGMFIPAVQGIITQVVYPVLLHQDEIPITSTFLTFFSLATIISISRYKLFNISESVEVETVLQNIKNIVFILSPEKKVIYMNPYAEEVFGNKDSKNDTISLKTFFTTTSEYVDFSSVVLERSLEGHPTKNYSTSLQNIEGEKMDVLLSAEIITNNNQLQGILIVANDVTEELKTLQELEISNERYQHVTQTTFDAIWDWDLNSNHIFWGKGIENLFGHTVNDLQHNSTSWTNYLHPDDIQRVMVKMNSVIDKNETHWQDEYKFRKADNEYAHVSFKGIVVRNAKGQAQRIIGAMQDITKEKNHVHEIIRIQQNLNSLINNTSDLIWSIDTNLKIITTNKAFSDTIESLTGNKIKEGDDVMQYNSFTDEMNTKWKNYFTRALSGETFSIEESVYNDREDAFQHSIISFNPIINSEENITGVACYAKNITPLKTAQDKLYTLNDDLKKRAAELSASNSELERFAYVASHDLQEPLRMVSSFLQLLEKKYKDNIDETGISYINFAINGANQMKRLILDLLEYSRIGTCKENADVTNMNDVITSVMGIMRKRIEETEAHIEFKDLPVLDQSNKTQMHQLMQNLVSNALKYQSDQKPKIYISANDENDHWLFKVKDNGIGIEEKFREKIFVIFQRLHNKNNYSGTGIGLSICKKIVEQHGGRIWIESQPGQGSTFYFTIAKLCKN